MKKTEPKKSGMPLLIIVGALVAVGLVAWYLYSSSPKRPVARNANSANRNAATPDMSKAPLGAQPPHMLGSANATVTVEEFADFQCPACAGTHPALKEIQSTYGNRIKFIYRNFPLQMHDKAYDAAAAAEAAGMQGSQNFWAMQNLLFTNQRSWSADPNYRQVFTDYARQLGLDVNRFQSDMAGMAAKTRIDADLARGRALNVSSTPAVYINGKSVPYEVMNVNSMRQMIDAELQAASAAPASNSAAPSNAAAGNASNSAAAPSNGAVSNTKK